MPRTIATGSGGKDLSKSFLDLTADDEPCVPLQCTRKPALKPLQVQDNRVAARTPLNQTVETYPLVGREQECGELDQFLQQSLSNGPGNGRSLYVSGGPGTGKTCSVRAGIKNWRSRVPDTCLLEVNCMDLTQRSVPAVLQRLLEKMGRPREAGRSMQGLAAVWPPVLLSSPLAW